jgi:hypothetical protein
MNLNVRTAGKIILWLLADALILYAVPVLYYNNLARQVSYEYAAGVRTSSDGDIVFIPVMGVFQVSIFGCSRRQSACHLLLRLAALPSAGGSTNRWTRAAGACFVTNLVRRMVL